MLFTCIKYQLSQSRAIGKGLLNLKNVFITNSSYSIPRVFSTGSAKGLGTNLLNNRKQIFTTFRTVSQNVASKKVKPDNTSIRRLLSLAKPEKIRLLFGVSLLFVSSAVVLIVPYGIGKVIDIIYTSPPENVADNLKNFCSVLLVIFLCGALANFGRIALMETASIRIVKRLRENLFSSVVKQEISFFDKTKTGELINRLSVDTSLVGNTLTMNISDGLRSVLQAFGGISWMLYTCPQLAAISLCTVPPLAMMSRLYGRFVKNITKNVQEANAKATEVAEERISSIRTVQAFTQEEREKFLYSDKINGVLNLSFKEALAKGVFWATTGLSGNMVVLMVFFYGGKMVGQGTITVGELSSFLVYAGFVGISIGGVTSFYSETMKGVGASSRIFELIDRVPKISPTTGLIPQGQVIGDIAFNNVFFSYPMRKDLPVLKDLNLQLPQGSVTAIVGASGSGKSTLANLMLRFYDPERGTIFLDKTDIRDINPTWLRQNIAIVSQDPVLFSSSIGENIRYGSPRFDEVTTEEIMESARKANADSFIDKFPQGLDTLVGERGIMLSGGQKQRIAIARAIIKNPRILLLDEATSALDAESEHLVQEALVRVMEGRTVMVIAHRLSTIRRADQIAVLCSGKIAELGTYDQLMDIPDGRFRKLVERQTISTESDGE